MGTLLKYMGVSDIRRFEAGETFSGQLGDPLKKDVVWDRSNNFIVDADKAGLSDEAVELLLELEMEGGHSEFKNVSGMKRVPTNAHQRTFMAMKDRQEAKAATEGVDSDEVDDSEEALTGDEASDAGKRGGASAPAAAGTRGGGTTARGGGRGGAGTTVGGSTAGG